VGDYADPNTFLDLFLANGGNNRTGWKDPAYDAIIAAAAAEPNPAGRFALLAQAEEMLVTKQAVVCPLYFYVGIQLYDPKRVAGIEPNVIDEHPIRLMKRIDR
jgi:ABC-type oligopeptide transport system substrate-binding subunit